MRQLYHTKAAGLNWINQTDWFHQLSAISVLETKMIHFLFYQCLLEIKDRSRRFPELWSCGHILATPLICYTAIFSSLWYANFHATNTKTKQHRTSNKPSGTPFDKRWALYFSHQKWNITLSHSLKSTKGNYPSFTQVPLGQESPIYLGPDVSTSQSGDSRPQRGLFTSLWGPVVSRRIRFSMPVLMPVHCLASDVNHITLVA